MTPAVEDVLRLTTELLDLLEVREPHRAVDAAWARIGAIKQLLRLALVRLAEDPPVDQVRQLTSQLNNLRAIVRGVVEADLAGDSERLSHEMCALHNTALRDLIRSGPLVSADNEPAPSDDAGLRRKQAREEERRLRRYDRD